MTGTKELSRFNLLNDSVTYGDSDRDWLGSIHADHST